MQGENRNGKRRTFALVILLFASFMDILDTMIINIAIPSIQSGLQAGSSAVEWTANAYILGMALIIITGGRLGDILGRKKMFMIGMAGFTIASAFSGLAATINVLIFSRAIQGIMAGIMIPQVLSYIQVLFAPKERAGALGAYSGISGFATVAGPILGAFLIKINLLQLGWRTLFLINVPIGVFIFIAAAIVLTESKSTNPLRVDILGTLMAMASLILLLYPLIQGNSLGWPVWTYISMAAALIVGILFIVYEKRRTKLNKSPLIALNLFQFKSFIGGVSVFTLFMIAMSGYFLVFTFYLQMGLQFTPLHAALTALPFSLMVPVMAGFSVMKLAPKFGRKVVVSGLILCAIGLAGVEWVMHGAGPSLSSWQLLPVLLIGGAGMGMVVASLTDFSLSQVPQQDAGSASGILNMMQQVGSSIGIAILGTIFFNFIGSLFEISGFAMGVRYAIWSAVGILILTIPFVFLLPKKIHQHTDSL
ncbi:MFS transporter [Clostridium aminobutyricum]|uniref:MFS transporter n=1 Tax=Clostridium aminobutyricum TaxID=33953 RepID=A0A939D7K1_CLOAM|nr:MFS transporter [Clostridium aminobutyricum]MBN7772283.1 MFS transporter [Clostridium aminobutyricum]